MICASFIQLLAAVDPNLPSLPSSLDRSTQKALGGTSAVIIAIILVVGLTVLWAVFIRKPTGAGQRGTLTESGRSGQRRKRRQSRHRNPTLAETGGLPPMGAGSSGDTNMPRT